MTTRVDPGGIYKQDRIGALNDITAAGSPIQIVQSESSGTYDPVTETYVGGSSTATIDTFTVLTSFKNREIDGTNILVGDRKFLIPTLLPDKANLLVLSKLDKMVFIGKSWNIVNFDSVAPDGNEIVFIVQGRE